MKTAVLLQSGSGQLLRLLEDPVIVKMSLEVLMVNGYSAYLVNQCFE